MRSFKQCKRFAKPDKKIIPVVVCFEELRRKGAHFGWRHRWRKRLRNLLLNLLFYCSLLFLGNVWNVLRKVTWLGDTPIAQCCDLSAGGHRKNLKNSKCSDRAEIWYGYVFDTARHDGDVVFARKWRHQAATPTLLTCCVKNQGARIELKFGT